MSRIDRRTSSLEELPPLQLRELRMLDLDEPPGDGQPAHVSSASGVARRGDFVYVIGDDLLSLAVFRMSSTEPGELRRVLPGELPADEDERKRLKPDLEALTVLPPYEGVPYGALLGLGSGSGEGRDRGFVWALAADGSLRREPEVVDLAPLYRLLSAQVDHLNIEGACVMGECLCLLHRGNMGEATNVVNYFDQNDAGPGFNRIAQEYGVRRNNASAQEKFELWASEVTAGHKHYGPQG